MKKENKNTVPETSELADANNTAAQTYHDLKNSVLIVSAVANLAIFTFWILLQITSQYDAELASFLLGR